MSKDISRRVQEEIYRAKKQAKTEENICTETNTAEDVEQSNTE